MSSSPPPIRDNSAPSARESRFGKKISVESVLIPLCHSENIWPPESEVVGSAVWNEKAFLRQTSSLTYEITKFARI